MTLTRADIVKEVRDRVRLEKPSRSRQQFLFPEFEYDVLPKSRVTALVNTLFDIIMKTLEKGESVRITGFGQFDVKFKWARKGRNPQTGEPIILDSRRVVKFRCAKRFREIINNGLGAKRPPPTGLGE